MMEQFIAETAVNMTETAVNLGVELTKLAVKGTASAVAKKVSAIKSVKDADTLRATYDEIVNELIQERDEAVRIAQSYKSELDRIVISDDDINHLHNTVSSVLDILKKTMPSAGNTNGKPSFYESIESAKALITIDTIKTMQLLGFNYKQAIGEPLTQLCADKISSLGQRGNINNQQQRRK